MIPKVFHFATLLILFSLLANGSSRTLPSYIKPCKRSDPNLEQCLMNLITGLKPRLPKGIPEMRIPPLDPFQLPEVRLDQGGGSPVNFKASFKNLVAEGAKDFVLKQMKIDWNGPSITFEIFFPKLRMISDYTINGKVLVVPINGNGKSNGTFSNVTAHVVLHGKFEQKHNKTYMTIKTRKVSLTLGGLHLYFANLFNGNKELSDSTNTFINQNWRDIIQEINPLIEDTIGEILLQLSKGLLDLYALEDLLPEA